MKPICQAKLEATPVQERTSSSWTTTLLNHQGQSARGWPVPDQGLLTTTTL
ncbi:MAG: hypothetical protein HOD72_00575 [Opitutae bacterium]|nr:hypothetical protein [Opitutae bacterium]